MLWLKKVRAFPTSTFCLINTMKTTKQKQLKQTESNELVRLELRQIQLEAQESAEREQMDNAQLHKEAHRLHLSACNARLQLWLRMTLKHQHN